MLTEQGSDEISRYSKYVSTNSIQYIHIRGRLRLPRGGGGQEFFKGDSGSSKRQVCGNFDTDMQIKTKPPKDPPLYTYIIDWAKV